LNFFVAFDEIEGLKGNPAVPAIDYLSVLVESFLTGLESDMHSILAGKPLP
jgi:hypothetical protein